MTISTALIIGLIIVLIILALATAAVAASYNQLFMEFEKNRKKFSKNKTSVEVTKGILEEERLVLKERFEHIMVSEAQEFQKMLSDLRAESIKLLTNMNELGRSDTEQALAEFRQMLTNIAKEEAQRTKQELDKYIAEKEKEIDAKAVAVLQSTAEMVLPQSIDMETKKDLIIAALEKAKKDNMFGI